MDSKQKGCAVNFLVLCLMFLGMYIYMIVQSGTIYKEQTALLDTGVKAEATIERVTHPGIWEIGKIYARLSYTVDGQDYATDVPISMRTYQFPGGKVQDGKTVVNVAYSADDPAQVGFEGAARTAKNARTLAIVLLCVDSVLTLLLMLGLIAAKLSE
ncbi:MAG: hypothetical protein VB061_08060 [Christensenella sp.]|nr:hypothetical protein [Christensenella sp.]